MWGPVGVDEELVAVSPMVRFSAELIAGRFVVALRSAASVRASFRREAHAVPNVSAECRTMGSGT